MPADVRSASAINLTGLGLFGLHYFVTLAWPNFEEEEQKLDGVAQQPGGSTPTEPPPLPTSTAPTHGPTLPPTSGAPAPGQPPSSTPPGAVQPPSPGDQPPAGAPEPLSDAEVESLLADLAEDEDQQLNWDESVVDLMKLLDLDSSVENRKELAGELGYTGDPGNSFLRNIWLQEQVRQGLAENGGELPEWLEDERVS